MPGKLRRDTETLPRAVTSRIIEYRENDMSEVIERYDFPPYRPPSEADSALIRVTRGCPWNRCRFCSMYKHTRFEVKPFEELELDVHTARRLFRHARSIFLGDSDNLAHNDLPAIVSLIRSTFPDVRRITSYARAKTILRRKPEYLRAVREAGLDRLHIGLESGDPVVLERLAKGVTPGEIASAGRRAGEFGFEVSFYVLSGAGGADRWREHARESARVCIDAEPDFIRLRTLTILRGTPLFELEEKGEFGITEPIDRLREVEMFLEHLDLPDSVLTSDHLTNYLWAGETIIYRGVAGRVPRDRGRMLETIRSAIELAESTDLELKDSNRLYREGYLDTL